jgi:hypothetical protein
LVANCKPQVNFDPILSHLHILCAFAYAVSREGGAILINVRNKLLVGSEIIIIIFVLKIEVGNFV